MAIGTTAALLIGGGLAGSAALSSNASRSASRTVQQGTDAATAEQRRQFDRMLQLQMPGYQRGEQAAGLYARALGIPSMTGGQTPQQPGAVQQGTATRAYPGLMTRQAGQVSEQGSYEPGLVGPGGVDPVTGPQINPGDGSMPQVGQPTAEVNGGPGDDIYAQIKNTPGYQAQLDQGITAIDRASPIRGGMYSGRRMKALNDYGQNTFGSYYQDWMNRVGGVAGQGAQTAQNVGAQGMNYANNVGNLMMTGANARAQGSLNSANAWTSAIGTGVGMYGGSQGWFG